MSYIKEEQSSEINMADLLDAVLDSSSAHAHYLEAERAAANTDYSDQCKTAKLTGRQNGNYIGSLMGAIQSTLNGIESWRHGASGAPLSERTQTAWDKVKENQTRLLEEVRSDPRKVGTSARSTSGGSDGSSSSGVEERVPLIPTDLHAQQVMDQEDPVDKKREEVEQHARATARLINLHRDLRGTSIKLHPILAALVVPGVGGSTVVASNPGTLEW